jgi:hypothetical protein
MAKKSNRTLLTFIGGAIIGGAITYLARGELERFMSALKPSTAARARMLYQ